LFFLVLNFKIGTWVIKSGKQVIALNFAPDPLKTLPVAVILDKIKTVCKDDVYEKMINFQPEDAEIPADSIILHNQFPEILGQKKTNKQVSVLDEKNIPTSANEGGRGGQFEGFQWYTISPKDYHNEIGDSVVVNPWQIDGAVDLTPAVLQEVFPGHKHGALYDRMLSHFGIVRTLRLH